MDADVSIVPRITPLELAQRELFCQEYIIDFNGGQAAIRAGYSAKIRSAHSQANRLLKCDDVRARIAHLVVKRAAQTGVQQARVVHELAAVGFSDIGEVMEWGPDGASMHPSEDLPPHVRAAIQSVKVEETVLHTFKSGDKLVKVKTEVKLHPKHSALDLLAQHTGMIGKGASRAPGGLTGLNRLGIFILPALDPEPDWDAQESGAEPEDEGYRIALPPLESENGDGNEAG